MMLNIRRGLTRGVAPGRLLSTTAARRLLSTTAADPSVIVERHDRTATVRLNAPPINALSLPLITELTHAVKELEQTEIEGLVLESAVPGIFTGGIHLPELLLADDGSTDQIATFWTAFQEMALVLHGTPLATVAAISGPCPAGGCLLALCSDERIMDSETRGGIGLNEASFGLVPPFWLSQLLIDVAGHRKAERMITRGMVLAPEEALAAGLVDELTSAADVGEVASARLDELLAVPGRAAAKRQLRKPWQAETRRRRDEDRESVLAAVRSPAVQQAVITYLEALKRKRRR